MLILLAIIQLLQSLSTAVIGGPKACGKERFESSLVQAEEYLLTCMRYIELNPVRANMVNDPAHYRWSSYRHNGLGQMNERITPHPISGAGQGRD